MTVEFEAKTVAVSFISALVQQLGAGNYLLLRYRRLIRCYDIFA